MASVCRTCGEPIQASARFCPSCGAAQSAPTSGDVRKVVTVLFADISGSTQLGEQLDPEAVRGLLGRHFAEAREILERHGGTVEKFIGDAVMAVFGVPAAHEDDALRAVRAALDLQHSVGRLNDDPRSAARLSVRMGINTGEVVTGSGIGETLVTGDTVNTAARLEQAADPGTILIGPDTVALVRDAVQIEPVEPIQAKGKAEPVPAVRVLDVVADVGRRRSDAPMVGRTTELAQLTGAFDEVARDGTVRLVSVVGFAGIGKSRLLQELADAVGERAGVLKGRCLPYGEGITYWPIREAILQLAAIDERHTPEEARSRLADLTGVEGDGLNAIAALIGLDAPTQRQEELFWSVRRVLEGAADRPLVLLLEDLHWAEDTLLDLLEYLGGTASGPMLVVASARPDLLERRPGWSAAGPVVELAGFGPEQADELLVNQPGGAALSEAMRARILEAADGNALFIEEMVAMLRERRSLVEIDGTWRLEGDAARIEIPPSIQALLGARLDGLDAGERTVLQHGAVAGRSFESAAVAEICPASIAGVLARLLLALVRGGLLQPDRAELSVGDAYRFRHILIRDAAYQALSKADRARLHERFAEWLEEAAGPRIGEFEEIVAYHLDQGLTYRRELGDADVEPLHVRAADWMLRAAQRALRRDDGRAALALFRRAAELARGRDDVEIEALRELSDLTQLVGEYAEAERAIDRLQDLAEAAGDAREAVMARIQRLYVLRHTDPPTFAERGKGELPEAIRVLEEAGDEVGLAAGWHAMGILAWPDTTLLMQHTERALEHARAAGDPRWLGWTLTSLATAPIGDATPVAEALPRLQAALEETATLGRMTYANMAVNLAVMEAMAGRYGDALARATEAREVHREFGHRMEHAGTAVAMTMIHLHGDRFHEAEPVLREAMEFLESIGERDEGPYVCAWLARCLAWQGRYEEAATFIERSQVDEADPVRETLWRAALSRVLAAGGDHGASIAEAERAVVGAPPESPTRRGFLLIDLAHALQAAGRVSDARAALAEARSLAERKGNVALVQIVDRRMPAR